MAVSASIRVSIVDANDAACTALSYLVRGTPGLRLSSAHADARSALREVPRLKPRPRVAVVSADLPDLSGIECARLLKKLVPQLRVLMILTGNHDVTLFRCLLAGAAGWEPRSSGARTVLASIIDVARPDTILRPEAAEAAHRFFQRLQPDGDSALPITSRELDVLLLHASGFAHKEISTALSLATETVHTNVTNGYAKLKVHKREALAEGLFQL